MSKTNYKRLIGVLLIPVMTILELGRVLFKTANLPKVSNWFDDKAERLMTWFF